MANISVRNLDDGVHEALRRRAERAGHSMEAEIRQILTDVTREDLPANPFLRLLTRAQEVGGVDLQLPPPEFDSAIDIHGEKFA